MSRSSTGLHPGILTLAITAFAIGVAEFIIVGILPSISTAFSISLASAGSLVGLYALALAIGTPLIVIGLGRFPKKIVLMILIGVFLLGNLISALAPNYPVLLLGRIITALAHGSFFAIGATVAAGLAREGQASKAIAVMFAGLTLAMVIGVPLGSYLGNALGWRLPFYAVALLALIALLATAVWLPRQPASKAGNALGQLAALRSPAIWAMMSVTILGFGASFSAFTFITPILTDITGFSASSASVLLLVFGVATMIGNLLGGRLSDSLGWERTLRLLFGVLALTLVALALSLQYKVLMVITMFVWGIVAFGMTPAFQTGMLSTARLHTPKAVDFASGLNISAFNLGITLGERAGSVLVENGQLAITPWAGVAAALLVNLPLAWLLWRRKVTMATC
ncbi:MFS transporter [Pseudomonas putida]|jgi:predicted MFS family arabinose efflux permease|uniref:MFS transporter n=1 Tax=Pseudomonas putida TaxID=303 RepID=UPI0023644530|nr:MFS transporter [Pseudomonas putida]MDD2003734.1 MFS transporter [Pseudomonas putida]